MLSSDSPSFDPAGPTIRDEAARWIVKRDRGLSPAEQREFERWLDDDPRHAAALARSERAWGMLDRVPARSVQLYRPALAEAPRRVRWHWPALGGLAAAVALALFYPRDPASDASPAPRPSSVTIASDAPRTTNLPDGTIVRLNVGAELALQFSAAERRVQLRRGEVYFTVTPDASRPFVVDAGGVNVRAVGTAFNVNLQAQAVDVIVTEGKVQVDSTAGEPAAGTGGSKEDAVVSGPASSLASVPRLAELPPLVGAGQRAVVSRVARAAEPAVVVSDVAPAEVARVLAWSHPLVRLGGATLAELARQFERQTGRRIVLADAALGELRVGGRFPGHDVEGFVRVLEENYGVRSERDAGGALVLRKAP